MKCFRHAAVEAVATCKYCSKGVCAECAKDTGVGIACSAACEGEVKAIQAMIVRNRKVYEFAPKTHSRNAIWLTLMAALFIGFGAFSDRGFLKAYFIAFGVVLLCGAGFSLLNSRRIARLALPKES
ncbi:MAG TPA: hypothetical protein VGF06_13160 [Terriglobales bacterium]|jgi:hypothetical protein